MEVSTDFEQVCVCVCVWCGMWERVRDTWRETEGQRVRESNLNFEIKKLLWPQCGNQLDKEQEQMFGRFRQL